MDINSSSGMGHFGKNKAGVLFAMFVSDKSAFNKLTTLGSGSGQRLLPSYEGTRQGLYTGWGFSAQHGFPHRVAARDEALWFLKA